MPIGREEDYYGGQPDGVPAADFPTATPYVSPAAMELTESGRDVKIDSIYQGVQELRGRSPAYSEAASGMPVYDDFQSAMTGSRVAYGDMPGMFVSGAGAGARTLAGGAHAGVSRMMADIGGVIRPITYTPPARVYAGYSGRVMQETGFFSSMRAMLEPAHAPRAMSPYLYGLNAAEDMGQRLGLSLGGAATTAGVLGASGLAGSIGGKMFGLPGSLAGGLAGYAVAGFAADQIYQGVEARQNIQDFLARTSDAYVTPGSTAADPRRGAGFSRAARREVAEFIRELDIKDPMMGTADLETTLRGATAMGMFTGVRETEDFKKRFKSIVQNLKVVTTTLGQTLEEGLQTMKDLKGIGIDQSMAGQTVIQAQTMGRMAGRTASEMVNIGLQGAEMYRGTGVTMGIGFQANIMNLASIRAARDAQLISQEAVAQAGGEEALAQRMTGSTLGYIQSAVGRGFGAMYFQQGQGFDPRAFMGAVGGDMDMGQAALRATRNLSSPRAIIEYMTNQEKFRSDQARTFGGRGLDVGMMNEAIMQATSVSRWTGTDMDTATRYILKTQMGLSDSEVQARLAEMKNPQEFFRNAQASALATRNQTAADQAINNFFLSRWEEKGQDIIKRAADVVAEPLNRMVDYVGESATRFYESNVLGIERFDLKDTGYRAFDEGRRGTASFTRDVEGRGATLRDQALARTYGFEVRRTGRVGRKQQLDLSDESGGIRLFTPDTEVTEFLDIAQDKEYAAIMKRAGVQLFNVESDKAEDLSVVLRRGWSTAGGMAQGLGPGAVENLKRLAGEVTLTREQAVSMTKEANVMELQKKADERIRGLAREGRLSSIETFGQLGKEIFGEDRMTPAQQAALIVASGGDKTLSDLYDRSRKASVAAADLLNKMDVREANILSEKAAGAAEAIGEKLGIKDATAVGFYAQAVIEKDSAVKEALLAKGAEALQKSGELSKVAAAERAVKDPSKGLTEYAEVMVVYNERLQAQREAVGMGMLPAQIRAELVQSGQKVTQADQVKIMGLVEEAAIGRAGFDAITAAPEFKENMQILRQTATGADLADRLGAYKAMQGFESAEMKTRAAREAALSSLNVSKNMIPGILDAYEQRGTAAAEDIVSKPFRDRAGTSGVATSGASGGVGTEAAGTAAEQYAIQTSINMQVLSAFEALARKLGATQ